MRISRVLPHAGRLLPAAMLFALCAAPACAATAVGTCRPNLASYDSFSDAIAGTSDGGTIYVCPGSYAEQVIVNKNLTFVGTTSGNSGLPVIVPPASGLTQNWFTFNVTSGFLQNALIAAQVVVSPGVTANFKNIAIDGTGNNLPVCARPVGIYFGDAGGTVDHVAFRYQTTPCGTGNPQGDSIFVQSNGALPAVVIVQNSSFHNPGWMAIHADGGGASLTAKNNTLVGPGATAGNGILIEYGATAPAITNNTESNALPDAQSTGFWGVLLNQCAGGTLVNANTLSNTQIGIVLECGSNTVSNNTIFNSQLDGIQLCGSGNTVNGNLINDSGRAGVNLAQGCAVASSNVYNNTIDGACTATLVGTDAGSNSVGPNNPFNTKYLALSGSTCN